MHTYLFNTDIFIQYQYNYSTHHILFNANIFIQCRNIYSIQIFIFNNPGPSAAISHDLLTILAGSTSCQGFARLHPSGTRSLSRVFTKARVKIFQGDSLKNVLGKELCQRHDMQLPEPAGPGVEAPGSS